MRSVRKQVSDSQLGSDVYGLREKIAYHYHLRDSSQSAEVNWFKAERDLEGWCLFQIQNRGDFRKPVECSFHRLLNKYAYENSQHRESSEDRQNSSFDDWMYAQNRLAEQIMHQVNIF